MQALPAAAKALLLRLLLRKRAWFQLGSLAYADVPQPEAAARRLAAVNLLQVGRAGTLAPYATICLEMGAPC